MSEPVIEVKNIGKKYRLGQNRGGYIALRDVLANVLKSPFSFLKHKAKVVAGLEKQEEFWALKNVNFTVNKGEVIGIIGRNGAGKSTLLKILSQITPPTEGEITIHGRVGSLLEVGTGFHPELTGRENIFLNGAILGMKRAETARKFDQIVEFSGVGKFIDTPVKRYSSGMYVRLAFSIAAHMEPDILLVDEVLAVGDAEFQKKCLGKMEEVTRQDGRTIIFISHNMSAIQELCEKTILFEDGKITMVGRTDDVIKHYLSNMPTEPTVVRAGNEFGQINSMKIVDTSLQKISQAYIDEEIGIEVEFEILSNERDVFVNYAIMTADNVEVLHTIYPGKPFGVGKHKIISWVPKNLLNNLKYRVFLSLVSYNPTTDHAISEIYFEMNEKAREEKYHGYTDGIHGVVRPEIKWEIKN